MLVLVTASLAAGQTDEKPALKALHLQAKAAAKATLAGDFEKLADLTFPKVVEAVGGKAKFIEAGNAFMQVLESKGWKFTDYKLDAPAETVGTDDHLFGLVKATLYMSLPQGKLTQETYLLGISTDKGKTWKFVDGAGMADPKAKKLLPTLPKSLQLPKLEPPQIEKN
jgi:hypothetical protein